MRIATLAQRDKLWEIIEQDETPRDQVQRLLASGLFPDILHADFEQRIDRDEFRRVLGLKPLEYTINVNYDLPLSEATHYLHVDSINCGITGANFVSARTGKASMKAILFKIDSTMETEEIIRKMDEQNLRPADLRELVAFGVKYPGLPLQQRIHVIALGASYKPTGENFARQVPGFVLQDYPKDTIGFSLCLYNEEWTPEDCRFLAVPR